METREENQTLREEMRWLSGPLREIKQGFVFKEDRLEDQVENFKVEKLLLRERKEGLVRRNTEFEERVVGLEEDVADTQRVVEQLSKEKRGWEKPFSLEEIHEKIERECIEREVALELCP
ncbi:hypothetical protein K432DRAFT_385984 [Lepidopterella palustris CBS 459.81]|uniref:Uncharacterized protein n=1 Tax=Lepidopterella palustris CBS 459.81 TaxID=1314670 RepID=A0A8E2JAR8_9PEZI|nr:hypothetical protein K432DRAFT_385984 [Lepidopterella palustris CBS 459.81]